MKVESGENDLVIQSLTGAFAVKHVAANTGCEFDVVIGDSVVINIFAATGVVVEENPFIEAEKNPFIEAPVIDFPA